MRALPVRAQVSCLFFGFSGRHRKTVCRASWILLSLWLARCAYNGHASCEMNESCTMHRASLADQRGHRQNLTEQEAKKLVLQAIAAGIDNDLGSGSNIDLCVITHDRGLEHHRGAWKDPGVDGAAACGDRQLSRGQSLHAHRRARKRPRVNKR